MAVAYVNMVLRGVFDVDPTAKLILVILAEHANRNSGGVAYPSVETIARMTGIRERQVQTQLRGLTAAGWLSPVGATNGGRGRSIRYRLNVARMRARMEKDAEARTLSRDETVHRGTPIDIEEGCAHVRERVRLTPKNGVPGNINTVQPDAPEPEVNQISTEVEPVRSYAWQHQRLAATLRLTEASVVQLPVIPPAHDHAGIDRIAKQLGMLGRGGESYAELRDRMLQRVAHLRRAQQASNSDSGTPNTMGATAAKHNRGTRL